ncbi:xaa-Pro dipeptidase-like [Larimichthys crocea]|uniref:xaa-Pro dipeptidase-like n=1 Tax=Larimichthys crocea TaxID=215358 RepID=UPI000F5D72FE|nr:xaa-Pro dipeptidase-like [Larimichthys crocea]
MGGEFYCYTLRHHLLSHTFVSPLEHSLENNVEALRIVDVLSNLKPATLLTLRGQNTDSGSICREASFEGISRFQVNTQSLWNAVYLRPIWSWRSCATPTEFPVKPTKCLFQHYCYTKGGMCHFVRHGWRVLLLHLRHHLLSQWAIHEAVHKRTVLAAIKPGPH